MPEVAPRHHRFAITVNGREYSLEDPVPTGRDILELAGLLPTDEHILFYRQTDGTFDDINLSQPFDVTAPGAEEFMAVKADRLFFLVADGRRFPWWKDVITGGELRVLAGISPERDLFFNRKDEADERIDDDRAVSLEGRGVEHFYSAERHCGPVMVSVELDGEKVEILSGDYTTETLKKALGVSDDWDLDIIDKEGCFHTLKPGELIKVVAHLKFVSHVRQGGSS